MQMNVVFCVIPSIFSILYLKFKFGPSGRKTPEQSRGHVRYALEAKEDSRDCRSCNYIRYSSQLHAYDYDLTFDYFS